MTHSLGYDEVH